MCWEDLSQVRCLKSSLARSVCPGYPSHVSTAKRSPRRPLGRPRAGKKRALPRVLCIVGPTASGKTALGIVLAKTFKAEVINADARQVYRQVDIGTGKPTEGRRGTYDGRRVYMVEGIPHYLMDFLPPKEPFTVAEWRKKATVAIHGIRKRRHLPVVVGGTGLYIQALVDNYRIPSVPPQATFRAAMESKTLEELVNILRTVDPDAERIVDLHNKRRVLRALEVSTFSGKPFSQQRGKAKPLFDVLLIGRRWSREELSSRINDAVERMVERGWIDEIRRLHDKGIPWDAPAMTSLGYRELGAYVRGEISQHEAVELTKRSTRQYAKRQMTWFKRDTRIHWVESGEEAEALVVKWLGKKKGR